MASYTREELAAYNPPPYWLEGTNELRNWYHGQPEDLRDKLDAAIELLAEHGPMLGRPHAETITAVPGYKTRHSNLKELRVTYRGDAYRVFFAFDPRRIAILLLGDRKPNEKWYKQAVPLAEKLYDEHLVELHKEGWL